MPLKTLTSLASVTLLAASSFAASTASVAVSATVSTAAVVSGMPATIAFGAVDPTVLANGNINGQPNNGVQIYNNNASTTTITTTCTNDGTNGCYICTGSGPCAAAASRVLLQCVYTPCNNGTQLTLTPTAAQPSGSAQVPIANSSPAVCTATPGIFQCNLTQTSGVVSQGSYTGTVNVSVATP